MEDMTTSAERDERRAEPAGEGEGTTANSCLLPRYAREGRWSIPAADGHAPLFQARPSFHPAGRIRDAGCRLFVPGHEPGIRAISTISPLEAFCICDSSVSSWPRA